MVGVEVLKQQWCGCVWDDMMGRRLTKATIMKGIMEIILQDIH